MAKEIAVLSTLSDKVDPYALFEALTGKKIGPDDFSESSSETFSEDYNFVTGHNASNLTTCQVLRPDPPPKDSELNIGAINPYALVEAMLGHRLDCGSTHVAKVISDVLQTDYDELFDMRNNSVLYAGLELNVEERRAEKLSRRDITILPEKDLQTPDLSGIQKLSDLEYVGLKALGQINVKTARLQNGKLHVVLDARSIAKTLSNRAVTRTINELAVPFRVEDERSFGVPPVCAWRNIDEVVFKNYHFKNSIQNLASEINHLEARHKNVTSVFADYSPATVQYDGPIQGACSNSWLIAAISSVFWSDPTVIHQVFRGDGPPYRKDKDSAQPFRHDVELHDKGGRNNAATRVLKVTYEVPVNKTMNEPIYCRSSGGTDYWPALYEKAFAMWFTAKDPYWGRPDRPDITQTAYGDPVKAMAQIDGREPQYFFTKSHHDLIGLVRQSSVNFRTKDPMVAWTHASGDLFRGANLVANHAYSILGWSNIGNRQYIVIRNPWGITEPPGLTNYPGLLDRVGPSFWPPAALLDSGGVMAVDAPYFCEYFACIGRTR
ncbi:hypothetical protein F5B22DRAFT_653655 [Xylaria bambusicola]|uniref:uncharacterized protein n=1 Tax=Xylaria bambusicola TaxID=326684 RepID=UPI00200761CF|nr:uncharacterized protein F5B22DRAFT_653655 [Xylaria bambusicola]KAI0520685.1 hypothetical protein F5B22DRAFT_653655 [Xylaria bambusicola]